MKEIITIKGNRKLWMEFAIKAKRNKDIIWDILEPFLKSYIRDKKKKVSKK